MLEKMRTVWRMLDGGRTCEKVGCSEKVWEDVRKGEEGLDDVRVGRRSEMVRGAGGCSRLQEELQESGRTSEEGDERS